MVKSQNLPPFGPRGWATQAPKNCRYSSHIVCGQCTLLVVYEGQMA